MNYNTLSEKSHLNAVEHGFWDVKESHEHYLMLVITEVGELVEAHRKANFTDRDAFDKYNGRIPADENFERFVKDSVQDEFADIAIRLFDLAGALGIDFDKMHPCRYHRAFNKFGFAENAFGLVKGLSRDAIGIEKRIQFGLEYTKRWAESLRIDIAWHIDRKMEYNAGRPVRHGKKY